MLRATLLAAWLLVSAVSYEVRTDPVPVAQEEVEPPAALADKPQDLGATSLATEPVPVAQDAVDGPKSPAGTPEEVGAASLATELEPAAQDETDPEAPAEAPEDLSHLYTPVVMEGAPMTLALRDATGFGPFYAGQGVKLAALRNNRVPGAGFRLNGTHIELVADPQMVLSVRTPEMNGPFWDGQDLVLMNRIEGRQCDAQNFTYQDGKIKVTARPDLAVAIFDPSRSGTRTVGQHITLWFTDEAERWDFSE